ncbi:DUF58 domain-containing protein [Acinetobacter ihumii]|uniref:DUF58 domain-containing protein n=1 Tax=Acinetobacter ihumii TaxID=2483802 RepID=UPI0010311684|nr:DUF58 domain-containing protein [Acinetobacter ihumii]
MQTAVQKWFAKRFRVDQSKILKQSDILVFCYQQGFLYLVLIVITFIAGINYANNLILGFCFLISAVLCISFYLTFKQLHQLKVEIIYPEVGQVGHFLVLKLQFRQLHMSTRFLQIRTEHQQQHMLFNQHDQQFELIFEPKQRGEFELPAIHIYSTYPFGLVRAWTYFYLQRKIWIAPNTVSIELDDQQQSQMNQHDLHEFRELRNFREGDGLQSVSWKQFARGQGLFVKVFENEMDQQRLMIDYADIPCQGHEQKLNWMMSLVELCEQRQETFALVLPHASLEYGSGEKQSIQARRLLAQA